MTRYAYTGKAQCRVCNAEEIRTQWLEFEEHPMDNTEMRCPRCGHYAAEFAQPNEDGKGGGSPVLRTG